MIDYSQIDFGTQPTPQQSYEQQAALVQQRRSQGLGALPSISGALSSAARSTIKGVTLQTQILPDLYYDPNAPAPTEPGMGAWIMRNVVKPTMILQTAGGPVEFAPYGRAEANYYPLIALGLTAAGVGLGFLAYKGVKSMVQG